MSAITENPPVPPFGTPRDSNENAVVQQPEEKVLPDLKTSDMGIDKRKPLPTSLQSDFIPDDILFALTQPPQIKDHLGPPSRIRNLNTSTSLVRPAANGVWNHKRRDRFKHLTENPPCICGAGKDISFLYDVPKQEKKLERPDKIDRSSPRKELAEKQKKPLALPDTLIPEEYHIVKNKGVMGIEFHEDKYSNLVEDHEKHLVKFPSMNPTSRYEVLQLKKTLSEMLDKSGVNDSDGEIKGPTQMHNLLELIKKEQNIYNVIFHELIRQTSVECVERGELLASLRMKYSELLNKVPQQIKSLHEEVMAQRALDRRLTEELMRFKSTISILTNELNAVKEHDRKVTKEAQQAQEDLKQALQDAQKNASLLAEYHDLYELQRKRLESQVFMLSEEKELWSQAAYSLALKVTEEANLTTAKRLHVCEKSWVKLATHFTILLSDKDTELLTRIQGHVEKWRDMVEEFNIILKHREQEMKTNIAGLRGGIKAWVKEIRLICFEETAESDYSRSLSASTKEGHFNRSPDDETLAKFLADMRKWEDVLSKETEKFGGDTLLNGQEQLMNIRRQMDGWTDNALKVFNRHRRESNANHPDHDRMNTMNEEVEELLKQFNNRITGENGVAPNAIHLMNGLETWDMRIASALNGTMPINDNEWGQLCMLMEEWLNAVDLTVEYVGHTQSEEDRAERRPHTRVEVMDTVRKVQKWTTTSSNAIDSEDAKLVEQVSSLHSSMVRWMVQMLLRLAPDRKDNSKEASDMALLGSAPLSQLHANIKSLFEQLEHFSNYVALCCSGIVMENTQLRRDNFDENSDHELKDLHRLRSECEEWIETAKLLTSQLLGESIESLFPVQVTPEEKRHKSWRGSEAEIVYHDKEKIEKTQEQQAIAEGKPQTEKPEEEQEQQQEQQQQQELEKTDEAAADQRKSEEEQTPDDQGVKQEETDEQKSDEKQTIDQQPTVPEDDHERLEVIGHDRNTHVKKMQQSQAEPMAPQGAKGADKALDAPDTHKAFEALKAVESLQEQLIATEERAQKAEERSATAESDLTNAQEKIRELEKRIAKLEQTETVSTPPEKPASGAPGTSASPAPAPADKEASKEDKKRPESKGSTKSSKGKKK